MKKWLFFAGLAAVAAWAASCLIARQADETDPAEVIFDEDDEEILAPVETAPPPLEEVSAETETPENAKKQAPLQENS